MTQYIKAPFNFVPLNDKVFFPDWADQISHDIPFEDGESGTIELELTAMTPIFVRNGHTRKDAEDKNDTYTSFSKDENGNYFIPATSVKGMIRNVLEIISFGKMDQISNDRFGFRDLHNTNQYMNFFQSGSVYCGYLKKINADKVEIIDHGVPFRISHDELDTIFGTKISAFYKNKENLKEANRTAKNKYELVGNQNFDSSFIQDDTLKTFDKDPRSFVRFKSSGNIKGKIVLTGQPGVREKKFDYKKQKDAWSGKFYEFVFSNKTLSEPKILAINDENDLRFKDFLFIHKDSTDWTDFRKKQFDKLESIPIFFIKNDAGKILHFGLSYLYKLPYNKRIKDCLSPEHTKKNADLADLIFGNQDFGLKGRVQFSNAKLDEGSTTSIVKPLMGSPKASYYPIYLRQKGSNGILLGNDYETLSSKNTVLKGWKRYPVHNQLAIIPTIDPKQIKNTSPFIPLSDQSRFRFKIRFHNLKREEIGALISALTFHKTENCYHTIGSGKAFGYGKLSLSKMQFNGKYSMDVYLNLFERSFENDTFKKFNNFKLQDSSEFKEFILMAQNQDIDSKLQYMPLPDFADAKSVKKSGGKLYLPVYSEYIQNSSQTSSHASQTNSPKRTITINKKDDLPKSERSSDSLTPLTLIIPKRIQPEADWLKAKFIGNKKVKIEGLDYEIALVIPREKQNVIFKVNGFIWVIEKQKTKDGKLNQVEFKGTFI